jgi:hypothetical protein
MSSNVGEGIIGSMTQGISNFAVNSLPTMGSVIGDTVVPGIGGAVGAAVGTSVQSMVGASVAGITDTSSSEGLLGAAEPAPVDRTILSFVGEEAPQSVTASVAPSTQQTEDIESLRHFFKRPVRLDSAPLTTKHAWLWPSEYFNQPAVAAKLKSYSGARYTLCFRITSNAMPFSNGAYLMSYLPNDAYSPDPDEVINSATTNDRLFYTVVAGFHGPHVVHDISQVSSSELRIPFWQPLRFLDTGTLLGVNSSQYSSNNLLGRLDITNLNAAIEAGYQSVDGQLEIWCWLEDLELFYPTDFDSTHSKANAPVRVATRYEYSESDREFQTQGPEHHSHGTGSTVVARRDYIDDVAHPPGIAKPMALTNTNTEPIGAFSDSILDYFKIYSFLGILHFGNETGPNTAGHIHVRPYTQTIFTKNVPGTTPPLKVPPPTKLAVATDMFQFWKGSINFRINFICSKFHSGRIQFGFVPHVALNQAYPTDENLWANINSQVLDLRTQHSIEINCPYRLSLNHAYRTDVSGTLVYRVISPLQAPAEATPKVMAYIEIAAGDDFSVSRYNPGSNAINWFGKETAKAGTTIRYAPDADGATVYTVSESNSVDDDAGYVTQGDSIGLAVKEEIRDVINDGVVGFSQIFAAGTSIETPFTTGSQTLYIGADNDVLVNCWSVPRPSQSIGNNMLINGSSPLIKARSLFYGYHGDNFLHNNAGNVKYGYGVNHDDVTFPYFSNAQYTGLGTLQLGGLLVGTSFGPITMAQGCVPNVHLFHPWVSPLINYIDPPRGVARLPTRFTSPIKHMKGHNRG